MIPVLHAAKVAKDLHVLSLDILALSHRAGVAARLAQDIGSNADVLVQLRFAVRGTNIQEKLGYLEQTGATTHEQHFIHKQLQNTFANT